ncbi:hypothetical protein [Aestuariispira insulae]|uniref:ABC transmembrane type-1 domain-containing protein n=1 Tax=Aestuariispira insulae TaxID=1461337 RepID=A0A3D9HE89_9PROT|nr:hypothetical protein [Aestuariispira insulae]RED47775.1 hypothetical protein DFP90_109139 [Aestuariispira insulae]
MDILTPLHDLTEWVIGPTMQHSHWWFHVVVHMSVVFVPLAFLTLFLALIGHLTGRLRRAIRQRSLSGHPLRYFYRHSRRAQILLLMMALASLPIFYASLELPKTIINEAINGENFPWIFVGYSFDKISFLLLLSFGYLAAVAGTGYAKFLINLWQGRLAERMTRRLRLKILRRWPARAAETGQAAMIPLLTQEVEPIGGFSGEAFVLPLQQAGTFFTILTFFFLQDPVLAAGALTLVPLQIYLIPRLQKRVNRLADVSP